LGVSGPSTSISLNSTPGWCFSPVRESASPPGTAPGQLLQQLAIPLHRAAGQPAIDLLNGQPDQQGVGLFARFGYADKDTSPTEWAVSGGVGGRGIIPSRDNDTFGIGYYYNRIQTLRLSNFLGLKDSAQGFECFYNIAITPASHVTLDLQVVETAQSRVDTATVLGLRASLNF